MNRFSSVLSGYIAACAVGGLLGTLVVALAPGYEVFWARVEAAPLRMALSLLVSTLYVGFFLLLSVWPAALALGSVAILLRISNWLYYALGGAVAGVAGAWLITLNPDTLLVEAPFSPDTALTNALIGTVMGSVYWYIARYRQARRFFHDEQENLGRQEKRAEESATEAFSQGVSKQGVSKDDEDVEKEANVEAVNAATAAHKKTANKAKNANKRQTKAAHQGKKPHKGGAHQEASQQSPSQQDQGTRQVRSKKKAASEAAPPRKPAKASNPISQAADRKTKGKAHNKKTAKPTDSSADPMAPKSFEDALAEKRGTMKVD